MTKLSPLLSISFRPFFMLAAIIAILNPVAWVLVYHDTISIPLTIVDPLFWHGHEMIFGFAGALIAGFILTASANWTSSEPYKGWPLLFLIILWGVERMVYFLPLNQLCLFVFMNLFLPALSLMLLKKLWNFPKQKYVFMPILLGLTLGKLLHSWGYLYSIDYLEISGKEIAIGLIRFIVLLIAGRVIPFFTKKKISEVDINLPQWINPMSLLPIALLIFPWPDSTPKPLLATILGFAIVANTLRQIMWKPFATIKVPILFILHIGIAFINLSLLMELIGLYDEQMHFSQAALHLFLAGGLGVVSIGIMTRVALGHTGRVITADKLTCFSYLLIILGALVRVIVPVLIPEFYFSSLYLASGFWSFGFFIFLLKYFKVFVYARPDGKSY